MSGWLALLILLAAGAAGFWALRLTPPVRLLALAALMLGAAGYALQGRPGLAAAPAQVAKGDIALDIDEIALRDSMINKFTADGAYLTASDAMTRFGDRRAAVRLILGGIGHYPQSFVLWTELGTTLSAHDGGAVSPAALFAFRQGIRVAPRHPAPRYRLGLALAMAGDLAGAQRNWERALALSPPGTAYRAQIADRLGVLQAMAR